MTGRVDLNYQTLFEVRLLHHYWLDEGTIIFDLITDPAQKNKRLQAYDRRSFLAVAPTAATATLLKALHCVYKDTALGFTVAASGLRAIPANVLFEFVVTVTHADFFNYTALTLPPQKVRELYHQAEDKTYRYKENVFVLANLTGTSRGTDANKTLFLSSKHPARGGRDKAENGVAAEAAPVSLAGNAPKPTLQRLSARTAHFPVFVSQDDVPVIVPPAGLVGAPKRGILLADGIPDTVFAVLRLTPVRADDDDFSFIDAGGHAKTPPPIFQVRFKNRSTLWRYLNKNTGAIYFAERNRPPLTYFGAEGLVNAEKSSSRIIRLVSERLIYPAITKWLGGEK
jgi:hypothetical protein